ncbi:voltage-gated potassium channel [Clostridium acetobutylicum]|uniref:Potassium channel subunit n=1 Tax=Clostridium acetobutylicum (strain ATCC 824 / DSM 792 / JCM 1419 / IAM 19013 / LMG 5710 / NBRC 13948 / NRRL B-527 / VKM B-1787 / 2291 / W) TaxID=272562 RepID=Q97JG8_CLOAB|nr:MULTISPECIES: potassium channel family protein [Clostridium]AAK79286.1 Potassium channel subunit [Clostridium acetobutylicum ATCC 824]ADZ20368.1 Potassium channel subunit [Clostridium acetobutylicum EA 2018]AEI31764.1 potassium channel subunit [Clostridium acetobutylicum DSM 1731]AWV81464.1 potassium channel protein [Clostridium acetobutylicum]MBC2393101.1 potassium channel family protein [Clostridium acetobutylicum]
MNITTHNKILYELTSSLLALIASIMLIIELSVKLSNETLYIFDTIDNIILIIFTIDYFLRLYISKDKKKFFKENIIDLLSIIPFNSIFQGFRLLKISKLLKFTKLIKFLKLFMAFSLLLRFKSHFTKFVKTNNFHYVIYTTIFVLITGTIGMHLTEGLSLGNALWWSFVTITTVGYGDISPSTPFGRVIASILMLIGIGFLSMLTGTISTFFISKKNGISYRNEIIENIKSKLDNFDELSTEDINDICSILKTLKN